MSKQAADYLADLSQDQEKLQSHKNDPDAAMDAAGLSDADKAALKSGDPQKIRQHLGDDGPPGCMVIMIA